MFQQFISWKLDSVGGLHPTAESYLILHRFGGVSAELTIAIEHLFISFRTLYISTALSFIRDLGQRLQVKTNIQQAHKNPNSFEDN